ncbi:MAG: ABC transporter ATP-binding protein [Pseudomonadota bacterium]
MLQLKNITAHYGKAMAIDDVSLEVGFASIVTLIGANGAGKSTTIKSISGLIPLTRGEIWFNGQRIDKMSCQDRVKMGIVHVPEERRIFPQMSVLDNLKTGAYLRKDKEIIKQDLSDVFSYFPVLKERTAQSGGSLSGGEQQMLAIGRAMMASPRIMLLDEPTMGLSPLYVKEVIRIVKTISINKQIAMLLVEQNAKMALKAAQTGYVLESGRVIQKGSSETLINDEKVRKAYLGG